MRLNPAINTFIPLELREKGFGPCLENPAATYSGEGVTALRGNPPKLLSERRDG